MSHITDMSTIIDSILEQQSSYHYIVLSELRKSIFMTFHDKHPISWFLMTCRIKEQFYDLFITHGNPPKNKKPTILGFFNTTKISATF